MGTTNDPDRKEHSTGQDFSRSIEAASGRGIQADSYRSARFILQALDRKIVPGPGVVRGVTYFENEWNFWVYPEAELAKLPARQKAREASTSVPASWKPGYSQDGPLARGADVVVTSSWEEAETKLAAGGRVLFVPRNSDLDWTSPPLDSVPVFWNRLMGPAWGRMLGLWIDRKPGETKTQALGRFPTSCAFRLAVGADHSQCPRGESRSPAGELEPVVWAIDDWNRNYKLGRHLRMRCRRRQAARLGIRCHKPADSNPVARQLRHSLLDYMRSIVFSRTSV